MSFQYFNLLAKRTRGGCKLKLNAPIVAFRPPEVMDFFQFARGNYLYTIYFHPVPYAEQLRAKNEKEKNEPKKKKAQETDFIKNQAKRVDNSQTTGWIAVEDFNPLHEFKISQYLSRYGVILRTIPRKKGGIFVKFDTAKAAYNALREPTKVLHCEKTFFRLRFVLHKELYQNAWTNAIQSGENM